MLRYLRVATSTVVHGGVHGPLNSASNSVHYFGLKSVLDLLNAYYLEVGSASTSDVAFLVHIGINSPMRWASCYIDHAGSAFVLFSPGWGKKNKKPLIPLAEPF